GGQQRVELIAPVLEQPAPATQQLLVGVAQQPFHLQQGTFRRRRVVLQLGQGQLLRHLQRQREPLLPQPLQQKGGLRRLALAAARSRGGWWPRVCSCFGSPPLFQSKVALVVPPKAPAAGGRRVTGAAGATPLRGGAGATPGATPPRRPPASRPAAPAAPG